MSDNGTHSADAPDLFGRLTPDNAALVLIDHQAGLFLGVQDFDQQILKNNTLGLAKAGKALGLPTVLTTSSALGPNGPTIPELRELFPDHEPIDRSPINLWDDNASRRAIEDTGRKKLIMAGITYDVCVLYPALAARAAGYDVYAVVDASGTWSTAAQMASQFRLMQAGVIPTNWISVVAELKHSESESWTPAVNEAFGDHMGLYDFLGDIATAR